MHSRMWLVENCIVQNLKKTPPDYCKITVVYRSVFKERQQAQDGVTYAKTHQELTNQFQSLDLKDPLEEEMATHPSILARIILWTEELRRL